jgi:hypothetical protein
LDTDFYTQHNDKPLDTDLKVTPYEKNVLDKKVEDSKSLIVPDCEENECKSVNEQMCNLNLVKNNQPIISLTQPKELPLVESEENSTVKYVEQKLINRKRKSMFDHRKFKKKIKK